MSCQTWYVHLMCNLPDLLFLQDLIGQYVMTYRIHVWYIYHLPTFGRFFGDQCRLICHRWVKQPYLSNILWLSICFLASNLPPKCLKRWQWRNRRGHHGGAGSPYCPHVLLSMDSELAGAAMFFFWCGPGGVQYTSLQFNSLDWFLDIFGIFSWTVW